MTAMGEGTADLAALTKRLGALTTRGAVIDAALVTAVMHAARGEHQQAAATMHDRLTGAAAGSGGWILPLEPLLDVAAHPAEWSAPLAMLRQRAA
jgi:hypothetical protein